VPPGLIEAETENKGNQQNQNALDARGNRVSNGFSQHQIGSGNGATSISFKKPNCLSVTTDNAEKMLWNITTIPMIPETRKEK